MRKSRFKFILMLIAACVAAAAFAGCSNSTDNAGGAGQGDQAGDRPIKLKFVGQGYSNMLNLPGYEDRSKNVGDYLRLIADEYTKLHPHVTFDVLSLNAADGTTQQMDVEIASGNLPNVLFDAEGRAGKYRGMGLTIALDEYITEEERSDYITGAMPEKDIWRIPIYFSPKVIAINKTMFEQAGLADLLPDPDSRKWTTDQYVEALRAIHNPPDVYATILFAKIQGAGESIMGYLWPFGAQMFNSGDYGKVALNSPEGLAGLQFYNSLLDSNLVAPAPTALTDDDMWAMFEKQQLAIAPEVPVFESIAADNGFEVYYVAYPTPPGKDKSPMAVFTDIVTVFENEDPAVQEEAVKFAKYVSEEWGSILAATRNSFPFRSSQMEQLTISDEQQAVFDLVKQEGIMNIGQHLSQYSEIRELYKDMNASMFTDAKTPEEALAWFETEVNKILEN